MKKPATQLSILLKRENKTLSNEKIALELRKIIRKKCKNFIYVSGHDVLDWRTKQTLPHSPEVKYALLSYFNVDNFSSLVLSKHNLEALIRNILYEHFKKVIGDDSSKYRSYDVRVLNAALNTKASPVTLTQAIILNYLYHQAESNDINDIKLIQLIDPSQLIVFAVNLLKKKNGFNMIDQHIIQIWNDFDRKKIDFRSIKKLVLRYTLSILWDNSDYLT